MAAPQGLRAMRSGLLLLLLLVTPLLLVTAQADASGPLASSGTPAGIRHNDPALAAQPAASILQQDASDSAQVAVGSPVPTSRVKASRMAAAMAAVERRNAASRPFAAGAATAAAAVSAADDYASSGSGVDAFQAGTTHQGIFDRHNNYRARHQAAALAWSSTLASQAAAYAARCNFAHDPSAGAGENLFATSDTSNPNGALMQAIDLWYNEVQSYNFNNPGFSSATGHFTQVVWRGSSTLGCAVQACNRGLGGTGWTQGSIVVCRYSPAGNVLGYFQSNVLPASSNPPPPVAPPPSPVTPPPPANPPPVTPPPVNPPPSNPPPANPPPANPPPAVPIPPGTLPSGYKFANPGCLYSPSQRSRMCMEDSGSAVLYANGFPGNAVWVSKNTMTSWFKPYRLALGQDGNLAVLDMLNRVLWQASTQLQGTAPYRMVVQDDGVAVLFDANNARIWSTNSRR